MIDINEIILWKPLKVVSVIIFLVALLLIPMSSFWAMITLFVLICLWSRVPCLISMFTKDLDVIDFFVVMLGIHVGGIFGGLFGGIVMMFTRIFGPNEWFLYTIKDSISLVICGFLTPLFYSMFGSALYTLYAFTALRWVIYLILTAILEPEYMGLELMLCTIGGFKSYLYNTFVMNTFEGHLTNLFIGGVKFNMGLLLFTGSIIGVFFLIARMGNYLEKVMPQKEVPLFVK
jgi:hypothetical protein